MFQSAPHFSSEANIAVQSVMPCNKWVSIRASLQQRGERAQVTATAVTAGAFQSAPHFSSEANALSPPKAPSGIVSIRASLQQRGELMVQVAPCSDVCFNPRLTSAARRTSAWRRSSSSPCCFNPRLTSAARRTPRIFRRDLHWLLFQSAPHFSSEANDRSLLATGADGQFQSAPHFSSEANRAGGFILAERDSVFQSAPHFSSEANVLLVNVSVPASVFQSAPHFSSEAN